MAGFKYSFIRSFLFVYSLFILNFSILSANENNVTFKEKLLESTDEEDKALVEDVLLSYHDLLEKYAQNINYDLDTIYNIYVELNDPFAKIATLASLRNQDIKDPRVIEVIYYALLEGIYSYREKDRDENIAYYWKVRAFATRLVIEKVSSFDKISAKRLIHALTLLINYDNENRSRSLALISLAELIKGTQSLFTPEEYNSYFSNIEGIYFRFLNEIEYSFHKFNTKKYYFHWALVKSFGILGSKKSVLQLLKLFNNFNYKIKYEIIRTIKKISSNDQKKS